MFGLFVHQLSARLDMHLPVGSGGGRLRRMLQSVLSEPVRFNHTDLFVQRRELFLQMHFVLLPHRQDLQRDKLRQLCARQFV